MSDDRTFDEQASTEQTKLEWQRPLQLFVITLVSVFYTGMLHASGTPPAPWQIAEIFRLGAPFAVPLLAILLCHEFGHYIAARIHRVPASLPYFLPAPWVSLFGTLGAVIAMRGRIRSRGALLDIGAAGPLAGMVVAVPVLLWGLSHSLLQPLPATGYDQEGQSLLYALLKLSVFGSIPKGYDVTLHPTALAGWAGLFVTMINLLPWGQLDGGHIAFALFGKRYYPVARWLRRLLPVLALYNLAYFAWPIFQNNSQLSYARAIGNSLFWVVWFFVLAIITRASGGEDHPPFDDAELGRVRQGVAWLCLALFVLLFMPTPFASY